MLRGLQPNDCGWSAIANNLANINTTRTAQGGPYRRQSVVFAERLEKALGSPAKFRGAGVQVVEIVHQSGRAPAGVRSLQSDAGDDRYVHFPNINVVNEMVDMITATRAYEANITAINAAKNNGFKGLRNRQGLRRLKRRIIDEHFFVNAPTFGVATTLCMYLRKSPLIVLLLENF